MTHDILQQGNTSSSERTAAAKKKRNISAMAVVLALFLMVVLIILGERAIFDLNRTFNPIAINKSADDPIPLYEGAGYASEDSALSTSSIYYPVQQQSEYRLYRILIHASFIIPVFLLMFVLYFWVWHKKSDSPFKVIVVGYLVFAFWMMLHLIFEIGGYVLEQYKSIGVYVVLIFLAALFTWLMIVLQKRMNRKHA